MTLNEYQKQALTTALSSGEPLKDLAHWVLGITGEAGEIAEKVKKIIRDKDGMVSEAEKADIIKEMGDVLWYLAVLSEHLGRDFESVAQANVDKLQSRQARGAIQGTGDNR